MSPLSLAAKIFLYGTVILVFFLSILFFWIAYGEPIHDINVWWLERSFYAKGIPHPSVSILMEKKKYLGGPSIHGDNRCVYAIGEMRIAPLSKEDVKHAYENIIVDFWGSRLPLKVFFADEYAGPHVLPFTDWQDKLLALPYSNNNITYVVYATTQRRILLSDWRCDD